MGMDAQVTIWVGVRSEDCDIDDLLKLLPKGVFDEDGYSGDAEIVEKFQEKYGCKPDVIRCSDDYAGFGLDVFSHDWDYGTVEFDTIKIDRKIYEETIKLRRLFQMCNIEDKIGIWCQTDWR